MYKLIDQEIAKYNITVSKEKIRDSIIKQRQLDKDETIEKYYKTLEYTEEEMINSQTEVLTKLALRNKHKKLVIEKEYGNNTFKIGDKKQLNYYEKYCKKMIDSADVKYLLDIKDIDFNN
jgi:hypothetical protein